MYNVLQWDPNFCKQIVSLSRIPTGSDMMRCELFYWCSVKLTQNMNRVAMCKASKINLRIFQFLTSWRTALHSIDINLEVISCHLNRSSLRHQGGHVYFYHFTKSVCNLTNRAMLQNLSKYIKVVTSHVFTSDPQKTTPDQVLVYNIKIASLEHYIY